MTKPLVLVTEHLDPVAAEWLEPHVQLVRCPYDDPGALEGYLPLAEGLVIRTYTRVDRPLLAKAPNLRVVGRAGVGLDTIDLPACQERGVKVVSTPDANTQAVVEYVWALIFDALRPRIDFREPIEPATFHTYRKTFCGRQIQTLTLGILGMGRIGRKVARVGRALGLKILYHDLLSPAYLHLPPDDTSLSVDKIDLLQSSDILTLHPDGRPSNRHLLDAKALSYLKPTCLLLNTARGFLIDPHALAAWARSSLDFGGQAILDVHEPEPPPLSYPLYHLPNVRLLPHLAARTYEAMEAMSWVVRDVLAVLRGEVPLFAAF